MVSQIFHADHYRLVFHDGQFGNFGQRLPHRGVWRVVNHQDERHAFAFVAFRLEHG